MKNVLKIILGYGIAVISCLSILIWTLKLWRADLYVPFQYGGDAWLVGMMVKGMINNGWVFHSALLGTPFGLDMYDFPAVPESLHLLILKFISFFSSDWAVVVNLYFLLGFLLTTVSCLYVFRHFGLSYPASLVGSLMFSFLPYHFLRGISHLFLSSYYMIPLMVMVILWISSDDQPLFKSRTTTRPGLRFISPKWIASVVICILVGSSGIYYAFFASFFLLISGIMSSIWKKRAYPLLTAILLVAILTTTLLINLSPSILYVLKHGRNLSVAQRSLVETEVYGLRITRLFFPISDHGIQAITKARQVYSNYLQGNGGESTEYLGICGIIGFFLLLFQLMKRNEKGMGMEEGLKSLFRPLALLNIYGLLLGTMSGFGVLFAYFISPQIRAYARISIFIAYFSLFAFTLLIEGFFIKYVNSIRTRILYALILGLILFIGLWDQTTKSPGPPLPWFSSIVPPYAETQSEFIKDRRFVKEIEASVPKGAMIFQLPYVPFPEASVHYISYDHLRGYLHSDHLRWSFGGMRGRKGDIWVKEISEKPLIEFVKTISLTGFSGIYLDRNGYPDGGKDLETKLVHLLGTKPIARSENRLLFFDMRGFNKKLKEESAKESSG